MWLWPITIARTMNPGQGGQEGWVRRRDEKQAETQYIAVGEVR